MSASITLSVGAQSRTRQSAMNNADAVDLLRDAAAHLAPGSAGLDLDDPVAVADWHLLRWARELRAAALAERRSQARDAAEQGVSEPPGGDLET